MASNQQTLSNALIITRREVRDSFRDWRILAPIIVLTFVFPVLAQFVAARFADFVAGFGAPLVGERTIPFLLMIVGFFPISISLVIALETFVGEKERRSLEPLLSTPLSNIELYIGKTLAAMIPPLLASYGGMTVYLISLLTGSLAWRPPAMQVVQIMLLTGVQALVMVAGAVVVSSQATSTRAANLLASFIIVPMAFVIQGESVIMFLAQDAFSQAGIGALWAIIVGMGLVAILLLRVGAAIFNREELLGRAIDSINLRAGIRNIWKHVRAVDAAGHTATSLWEWYRRSIPYSLAKLRPAVYVSLLVFVAALFLGFFVGLNPEYQLDLEPGLIVRGSGITAEAADLPLGGQSGPTFGLFRQNLGVLLVSTALGAITFGVVTLVLNPLTFIVLGYAACQLFITGNDPGLVAAAILPHGWVEIPTILIATAAALRLGAVITRLPPGKTVGQAWIEALGETIKLGVGVVLPGLIIAAILESTLTFRVVAWYLGG
ncbi:MAG: stage II sporulation protein M [Chloroflexi bacterium]|nr:stage II sporulation protein M [Chloroflexota bacterium]